MATTIPGTGSIPISGATHPVDPLIDLESLQYQLAVELTRLTAHKASQVQSRVEAAGPLLKLDQAMGAFVLSDAGTPLDEQLVARASQGNPAELDAWMSAHGNYLGGTGEERQRLQAMLLEVDLPFPEEKVPVYMVNYVHTTHHNETTSTKTAELVWMSRAQRDALENSMQPSRQQDGVSILAGPLVNTTPDEDTTVTTQQIAVCLDRSAGPHVTAVELAALREQTGARVSEALAGIQDQQLQVKAHVSELLKLIDADDRRLQAVRAQRENELQALAEADKTLVQREQLRTRQRDRDASRPLNATHGATLTPGSGRTASFSSDVVLTQLDKGRID